MPNATYAYRHVKRDLAQLNVEVFPSRMWHENPTQAIHDEQLHPYAGWFPCNSFQFEDAEATLGILHIPYGNEIVWRQGNPTASGKPRLIVDNLGTVQKLVDYGLITSASKINLLAYKTLLDQQDPLSQRPEHTRTPIPRTVVHPHARTSFPEQSKLTPSILSAPKYPGN